MKKELKQLIKDKKLSDDQILKILQSYSEPERDVRDEEDESEDADDSKDQQHAESESAQKETPNKNVTMEDLQKLIAKSVADALKAKDDESKLPSQKPIKKSEPKPKPLVTSDFKLGEFNLIQ